MIVLGPSCGGGGRLGGVGRLLWWCWREACACSEWVGELEAVEGEEWWVAGLSDSWRRRATSMVGSSAAWVGCGGSDFDEKGWGTGGMVVSTGLR